MKTIPVLLQSHYEQEVTTICHCWKITLSDGTIMGFSNHTDDIYIKEDGIVYKAETGFTASAVRQSNMADVDNFDIQSFLTSDLITAEEITAGKWNNASIEIFKINYKAPDAGREYITAGKIGDITYNKDFFQAEFRSISQLLQRPVGEVTSETCRARLGDNRCKVDLSAFTFSGTVEIVFSNNNQFLSSDVTQAQDYFKYGFVTFTSGANVGLSVEVKSNSNGLVLLQLPLPYPMQAGDTFSILAGCDGYLATCRDKFNNIKNMRAEPYAPTQDQVLAGPDRDA